MGKCLVTCHTDLINSCLKFSHYFYKGDGELMYSRVYDKPDETCYLKLTFCVCTPRNECQYGKRLKPKVCFTNAYVS